MTKDANEKKLIALRAAAWAEAEAKLAYERAIAKRGEAAKVAMEAGYDASAIAEAHAVGWALGQREVA